VETAKNSRPSKRYGHIAVVHEEQMIVFGGYDDFGLKCNDMYEFNLRKYTPPHLAAIPPSYLVINRNRNLEGNISVWRQTFRSIPLLRRSL